MADRTEQEITKADNAAKVVAAIIVGGMILMFGYGIFGWILR